MSVRQTISLRKVDAVPRTSVLSPQIFKHEAKFKTAAGPSTLLP